MTEETAITIPDDVRAAFVTFDDDYLADVLRLWNCDLKCWYEPCMIVLRFENDDVLIWQEANTMRCQKGAVDTTIIGSDISENTEEIVDEDACLCWIGDTIYSRFIGTSGRILELLDVVLVALRNQENALVEHFEDSLSDQVSAFLIERAEV